MLFRRRTPQKRVERIRVALWPSNGWSRSIQYFSKRVLRLAGSPHAIALGFAAGVFASWTPFIGLHILLSVALAFVIGGNFLAAALGTFVGNPFTFPFIWWSSFALGNRLLDAPGDEMSFRDLASGLTHQPLSGILPIIKPMTIGAVPLGIASGVVAYVIVVLGVKAYQAARRHRLAARRIERAAALAEIAGGDPAP
ncbi:MAG: DUF2062 domain-containing protein [Bauldia sp.]